MGTSNVFKEVWHQLASEIEGNLISKRIAWQHNSPRAKRVIRDSRREPEEVREASAFHIQHNLVHPPIKVDEIFGPTWNPLGETNVG